MSYIFSGNNNDYLEIWRKKTAKIVRIYKYYSSIAECDTISLIYGGKVVVVGDGCSINFWNFRNCKILRELNEHFWWV